MASYHAGWGPIDANTIQECFHKHFLWPGDVIICRGYPQKLRTAISFVQYGLLKQFYRQTVRTKLTPEERVMFRFWSQFTHTNLLVDGSMYISPEYPWAAVYVWSMFPPNTAIAVFRRKGVESPGRSEQIVTEALRKVHSEDDAYPWWELFAYLWHFVRRDFSARRRPWMASQKYNVCSGWVIDIQNRAGVKPELLPENWFPARFACDRLHFDFIMKGVFLP